MKRKPALEIARVLAMAHKGATATDIAVGMNKTIRFVQDVCDEAGMKIRTTAVLPVPVVEPMPDPLAAYRPKRNEPRIDYADRILRTDGRITAFRGIHYLDDKPINVLDTMIAANKRLKQLGLPQIVGDRAWQA